MNVSGVLELFPSLALAKTRIGVQIAFVLDLFVDSRNFIMKSVRPFALSADRITWFKSPRPGLQLLALMVQTLFVTYPSMLGTETLLKNISNLSAS